MLLNLICVLSALAALGICAGAGGFSTLAWLWLLPLGFVGCALLGLLACLVLLLITEKHTDPEGEFETDDPYIRGIIRWYAPAVFRLLGCKIQASGTEKLPADGRFLLVSNHLADLDPGIFFTVFPKTSSPSSPRRRCGICPSWASSCAGSCASSSTGRTTGRR